MLTSFSEFKFYQSFRIPVEQADELRFLLEVEDELGNSRYVEDAKLVDISVTGFGFSTQERLLVGTMINVSCQYKKSHIDLAGKIVRSFSNVLEDESLIYGVEIDDEPRIKKFLENYIAGFSPERLKGCLVDSAIKERYTKASDGFEMFSLLLSLFNDITKFGDKEGFIENMLDEVVRILNAQRASIFLINPESNELEAIAALGVEKGSLKFDYRKGIAGSVFTTGVALNIDTVNDRISFNEEFDEKLGFKTTSIICYPIHNREDKTIGVIEVLNKRNQDRFTVEDEKTMKVISLVFSSVFHKFNPVSEHTQIRRFSTPFDREYAFIGKSSQVKELRGTIIKLKDLDLPLLIEGEFGVGKTLFSKIIHFEGKRGLHHFDILECTLPTAKLEERLFGPNSILVNAQGGTIVLRQVEFMPMEIQHKLYDTLIARRVDGSKFSLDVRVLATTNMDLGLRVENGMFYREFYSYLNKTYIQIPPLRSRVEDIENLLNYFLKVECKKKGFLLKCFSEKVVKKMRNYTWPGNVQELQVCVERAILYNPKQHIINEFDIDSNILPMTDQSKKKATFGSLEHVGNYEIPLKDRVILVERQLIDDEIKRHNGNKSQAAKAMGISREALRKKMQHSDEISVTLEKVAKKAA